MDESLNQSYYYSYLTDNFTLPGTSPAEYWVHMIVLSTIFAVGIPANALVIIVLLFSRTNGFSVTSIYILNMAFVDLLLLCIQVFLKLRELVALHHPEADFVLYHATDLNCKIMVGYVYVNMTVSILTLTALSISRYCAVMHPVGTRVARSKRRTLMILAGIWVVCLVYCGVPFYHITVVHFTSVGMCLFHWMDVIHRFIFSGSLILVFYVLPLVVITTCYASMAKVLWNAGSEISCNRSGAASRQSRRKVARMVLVLVVCFALCWLPYHIRTLLEMLGATNNTSPFLQFSFVCRALGYLNSCLNPLLYSFLGENFRSQMRGVFFPCVNSIPYLKDRSRGTTVMQEFNGSTRANNNSADTQMTYAGHTKLMMVTKGL